MAVNGAAVVVVAALAADATPAAEPRVAIVTGAGSGIGRALATALAAQGWRLVTVGRRLERLLETGAGSCDPQAFHPIAVDVASPGAAPRVVTEALAAFGRIDALVNNAGLARFAPVLEADPSDIELMARTNLIAPLALIRAAVPELRRRGGAIVNVGSIGGLLALPGRSGYGATKAALHHLTRSLARELAPEVRVNAVAPGAVDTEIYRELGWDDDAVDRLRAELVRTTPLGRIGRPDDVVPWIQALLGPAGAWVTGSLIVVDGGRSC